MGFPTREHQVLLQNENKKILVEVYLLTENGSTWYSSVIKNIQTDTLSTSTYKTYKAAERQFYQDVGRLFQRSQVTGYTLTWSF